MTAPIEPLQTAKSSRSEPVDMAESLIPTLSKARIPQRLSYPVGAKDVSLALTGAPQFADLKLHFYFSSDNQLKWGHYEFLRAEYLNNAPAAWKWPISHLYLRPPQWRWEVLVQPVPRILRHHVKQYVLQVALPTVREWFAERAALCQRGNDILAFFYEENEGKFLLRRLSRLEPIRG